MARLHNRPAVAFAAGAVVLLLLLAATPTNARLGAMMSPWDAEPGYVSRNLLVSLASWWCAAAVQSLSAVGMSWF